KSEPGMYIGTRCPKRTQRSFSPVFAMASQTCSSVAPSGKGLSMTGFKSGRPSARPMAAANFSRRPTSALGDRGSSSCWGPVVAICGAAAGVRPEDGSSDVRQAPAATADASPTVITEVRNRTIVRKTSSHLRNEKRCPACPHWAPVLMLAALPRAPSCRARSPRRCSTSAPPLVSTCSLHPTRPGDARATARSAIGPNPRPKALDAAARTSDQARWREAHIYLHEARHAPILCSSPPPPPRRLLRGMLHQGQDLRYPRGELLRGLRWRQGEVQRRIGKRHRRTGRLPLRRAGARGPLQRSPVSER